MHDLVAAADNAIYLAIKSDHPDFSGGWMNLVPEEATLNYSDDQDWLHFLGEIVRRYRIQIPGHICPPAANFFGYKSSILENLRDDLVGATTPILAEIDISGARSKGLLRTIRWSGMGRWYRPETIISAMPGENCRDRSIWAIRAKDRHFSPVLNMNICGDIRAILGLFQISTGTALHWATGGGTTTNSGSK